jgi:NTP pyrophosphatase (non-canonical NTP hydrolase)
MKNLEQLKELREEIYANNKQKGFWPEEGRNFGELLMLVTSELSEALEAHRIGKTADIAMFNKERMASPFHERAATIDAFVIHIKNSVEDEIADAVIRLLDMATGLNIDLEWHILAKLEYNKTRDHKHGKAY